MSSWPERYESAVQFLWDHFDQPLSWRVVLAECEEILTELTCGSPEEASDEFMEIMTSIKNGIDADYGESADHLAVSEVIHPGRFVVFESTPAGQDLFEVHEDALAQLARIRGLPPPEPDVLEAMAHQEMFAAYGVMQWQHFGRRVYVLGSETAELLARTDLPNARIDDISVPFPTFYLQIPPGMYSMATPYGNRSVDGVLVSASDSAAGTGRPREFHFLICPRDDSTFGALHLKTFAITQPDQPLPEVVGGMQEFLGELDTIISTARGIEGPDLDAIPNLVFGFLLYLMSDHPHVVPIRAPTRGPGKGKKRKRKQRPESKVRYLQVGHHASERRRAGAPHHTPLTHQTWVRGHWRHQAHGPRHSLRRWTWIEPHRRGEDLAQQVDAHVARIQAGTQRDPSPD